jgi:hypothetical protein
MGLPSPFISSVTIGGAGVSTVRNQIIKASLFGGDGFGGLSVNNCDGSIVLPSGVTLDVGLSGGASLEASTVDIEGSLLAPGGKVSLQADLTPYSLENLNGIVPAPHTASITDILVKRSDGTFVALYGPGAILLPNQTVATAITDPANYSHRQAGIVTLGVNATISTSGLIINDLLSSVTRGNGPVVVNAGSISVTGYQLNLDGGVMNVSGGVQFSSSAQNYGNAGTIAIKAGQDPIIPTIVGGGLSLKSTMMGYAESAYLSPKITPRNAGTLSIAANAIQIGGGGADPRVTVLSPGIFSSGGFGTFNLTGIGIAGPSAGLYIPGVSVAAGVVLHPRVESIMAFISGGQISQQVYVPGNFSGAASSITLSATGLQDRNLETESQLLIRGDVVINSGSSIVLDPQVIVSGNSASSKTSALSIVGDTVAIAGNLTVAGGSIFLSGANSLPQNGQPPSAPYITTDLAPGVQISTAGKALLAQDPLRMRSVFGTVLPGGTISIGGNILAETGAILNASGASSILDLMGYQLQQSAQSIIPYRVDSEGGSIVLKGAQELYVAGAGSLPSLIALSGGSTASGGTLRVSSGTFLNHRLDPNLSLTQSGNPVPAGFTYSGPGPAGAIARSISGSDGGFLSTDSFVAGGFSSVNLNGNVSFQGDVNISTPLSLTVGSGALISGNGNITLSSSYVRLGTPLIAPLAPADPARSFTLNENNQPVTAVPSYGTGTLQVTAQVIDIANLSLGGIGRVSLNAPGGIIRGDGTLDMMGDLTLNSAQVFPVSGTDFMIAAYDHGGHHGSVTVNQSGSLGFLPLSAGGSLSIYADTITENGTLLAPFGQIHLGAVSSPPNDPLYYGQTVPLSRNLILGGGGIVSVSGAGLTVPFGISADGTSWIDPSGTDITSTGLSQKSLSLAAASITDGAQIDLSGGGGVTASQWVSGLGGTLNLLGSPVSWTGTAAYQAGALVTYNDAVWSARQAVSAGVTPSVSASWTKLPTYYAIVPGYSYPVAPTGYSDGALKVGSMVRMPNVSGLAAGNYTLLPASYASLPGAYLVSVNSFITPFVGSMTQPDGSVLTHATLFNGLDKSVTSPDSTVTLQILNSAAIAARAQYKTISADGFFSAVGPNLPKNSGSLSFQGTSLSLDGAIVKGRSFSEGLAAAIDIGLSSAIRINQTGSGSAFGGTYLSSTAFDTWNYGSLLIGGLRGGSSIGGTPVTLTSSSVTLQSGASLSGSDIILTAGQLTLEDGSSLAAVGHGLAPNEQLVIGDASVPGSGNGSLLRVSGDESVSLIRQGVQTQAQQSALLPSVAADISILGNASLNGQSILIDSTYLGHLSSLASLAFQSATIDAGSISLVLDPSAILSAGDRNSLQIQGNPLTALQAGRVVSLGSYSTLDLYGAGHSVAFGNASQNLSLHAGEISAGDVSAISVTSRSLLIDNAFSSIDPSGGSPVTSGGSLSFTSGSTTLGGGSMSIGGFANVFFGVLPDGALIGDSANLTVAGNLSLNTPLITGISSSVSSITSLGNLSISSTSPGVYNDSLASGLGAKLTLRGAAINDASPIILHSGSVKLESTGAVTPWAITVSAMIDASGSEVILAKTVQFSPGGSITLKSDTGGINLAAGTLDVSGAGDSSGWSDAGSISISAPAGTMSFPLSMKAVSTLGASGSFFMDVASFNNGGNAANPSDIGSLETVLTSDNLVNSQNLRIRSGDILLPTATTARAYSYTLTADTGSIDIQGMVDASMVPIKDPAGNPIMKGGSINLFAGKSVVVNSDTPGAPARLSVAARNYDNSGKGGSIDIETGNNPGVNNSKAWLTLGANSLIDLSVAAPARSIDQFGSTDQFSGVLTLRAPQTSGGADLQINPILAQVVGASTIHLVGVYRQDAATVGTASIDPGTGAANDYENNAYLNAQAFGGNYVSILNRILPGGSSLLSVTQINPGEEIINSLGGLQLNHTWDLSSADWRYGPVMAALYGSVNPLMDPTLAGTPVLDGNGNPITTGAWAGYLSLRAKGSIVLHGAITDGFGDGVNALADANNGNLYQPGIDPSSPSVGSMSHADASYGILLNDGSTSDGLLFEPLLPLVATQDAANTAAQNGTSVAISDRQSQLSWSYLLTAGADIWSANPNSISTVSSLNSFGHPISGNIEVGARIQGQNKSSDGANALTASLLEGYNQVIRTGTGDVTLNASGDLQLWNQFAAIYTAGTLVRDPSLTAQNGTATFEVPYPDLSQQSPDKLGVTQEYAYGVQPTSVVQYTYGGGNIAIHAGHDVTHLTLSAADSSINVADSVRELPSNWLYRRGALDDSGKFLVDKNNKSDAIQGSGYDRLINSTSWWVDFSNFFEGVGALGGGNLSLRADNSISNVDAVIPTNFRMPGKDSSGNLILAGSSSGIELGGGDLKVSSGGNLDAGVYYVEKGQATFSSGGSIITNPTRDPYVGTRKSDPNNYLPTSFFLGKGQLKVSAVGNILLGPTANPFLTPQGVNNGFWYKDYFSTYAASDTVDVISLAGSITFREAGINPTLSKPQPLLQQWMNQDVLFNGLTTSATSQPWLRLAVPSVGDLGSLLSLQPPSLKALSLAGSITFQGDYISSPAPLGGFSIVAAGGVQGLVQGGIGLEPKAKQVWVASTINISDSDPSKIPSPSSPLAQQAQYSGLNNNIDNPTISIVSPIAAMFAETGSYVGQNGSVQKLTQLHGNSLLHANDTVPVSIIAGSGNISGLTLFSPKETRITSGGDITDVGLYIQNDTTGSISVVSAAGDIVLYDPTSPTQIIANSKTINPLKQSVPIQNGDIQISGPGTLEVLAAGNIDLGNNPGSTDRSLRVGITSIGNSRNLNIPSDALGADLIVGAGVSMLGDGGAAFESYATSVLASPDAPRLLGDLVKSMDFAGADFLSSLGNVNFGALSDDQKEILGLNLMYMVLRDAGRDRNNPNAIGYGSYTAGEEVLKKVFGSFPTTDTPVKNITLWSQNISTLNGGNVEIFNPVGGVSLASISTKASSEVAPGIITQGGGNIDIYTYENVSLGIGRIFTLKGGDIVIWSEAGNIAAGASSKTVQSAPPTRVLLDPQSANVLTDLAGLATGGGIGTLATVVGVAPSSVDLIAVSGIIDAGDAGIRSSGNLNLAATKILNADNIAVGGLSVGVPPLATSSAPAAAPVAAAPPTAAPSSAASTAAAAASSAADKTADKSTANQVESTPSVISIDIMGYGGGDGDDDDSRKKAADAAVAPVQASL